MKKYLVYILAFLPIFSFATEKCEWKVVKIQGYPTIKDHQPTINFDKEKDRVYGRASCNNYFGSYKESGDNISFDKIGSTLMACYPDEVNKQESEFIKLMGEVTSVSHAKNYDIYLDKNFNKLFEAKKCQ